MLDVDHAADVQALREQGFEGHYVGLAPDSSQGMLDNITAALQQQPLPGYELQDAAQQLMQVTPRRHAASTWPVVHNFVAAATLQPFRGVYKRN